jgi:hypothetical protein
MAEDYGFIHAGAVSTSSTKSPKFLSSQQREKIRRKEMKERNLRYIPSTSQDIIIL